MDALGLSRLVFVTGASRGIGRAIAEAFIDAGYMVAVGYNVSSDTAHEVVSGRDNALAVRVNIASRESIRCALGRCRDYFGAPVGVLVNNAAIAQEKPFFELTDEDWDTMLSVNLRSNFVFAQEVLPEMLRGNWGRIINISSIGGQWGGFNQVHYAAAKAGQINLTRSLAKLFSSQGIATNAVAIGLARTDMSAREIDCKDSVAKIQGIPSGRLASKGEIAATCLFLASDDAAYITGQTINVNGGMLFV